MEITDDYIERKKVIEALCDDCWHVAPNPPLECAVAKGCVTYKKIASIPAADVEPKRDLVNNAITKEEAVKLLNELIKEQEDNTESLHYRADILLCKILKSLGYNELVELYESFEKWYS